MMEEITDRYKLLEIQRRIPALNVDPFEQIQLYRAWEFTHNHESGNGTWYQVEIKYNQHWVLRGMLDYDRGILYLDVASMLLLVEQRIQAQLDAFNAGHHWRYKGL